jgi:hypothetical protein
MVHKLMMFSFYSQAGNIPSFAIWQLASNFAAANVANVMRGNFSDHLKHQ